LVTAHIPRVLCAAMDRVIGSPYLQFGGPLLIAGIGEYVRERGASVGLYLTALGLLIFALAGFQQLRQRFSFRGSHLGFDAYFRWKSGTAGTALVPEAAAPATPSQTPTMIARPYGLGHPPDITVEINEHEWTRTPVGRLILRTKVRIHNSNQGAVRTIRQHWLLCPGYPQGNYGPLSLQTPGLSQMVGPVKPGETLEGHIYTELPNAGPTGPGAYDLYFEDDLGHVTKAIKPKSS
jgi:hypothetical protein